MNKKEAGSFMIKKWLVCHVSLESLIMDSNFILVNRTIIKFIYNLDGRQQEERN